MARPRPRPTSPPLEQPRIYFWMAMMFAIFGAFAMVTSVVLVVSEIGRTGWSTVEGRVTLSSASALDRENERGRSWRVYSPEVWYDYEVSGRRYQSHRLSTDTWNTSSLARVEKYLERYPSGGAVKVYYDPRNPADSRLEVGINWLYGLGFLLALLFGGLAVWMFRYWRRSLRADAA